MEYWAAVPKLRQKNTIIECRLEDETLSTNILPLCSMRKSTTPTSESVEELSESSDRDEENQSLSEVPKQNKGKKALASTPNFSKQPRQKSIESNEARDANLAFSESLFA